MIELSRDLIRRFRAVLRKTVLAGDCRSPSFSVLCQSGKHGLTLSCQDGDIALGYRLPGSIASDAIALPGKLLADLENRSPAIIQLEQTSPTLGKATLIDPVAPRTFEFLTVSPESLRPPPNPAGKPIQLEPTFLAALAEAARTTNRDSVRYALQYIVLCGQNGAIIATDGRQLLIQEGFSFPWQNRVLIPGLPVFGCREIPVDQPVLLGCKGEQVSLEIGPWLLSMKTDKSLRYPDVEVIIPSTKGPLTFLHLDPHDAEALKQALPKMPGRDVEHSPVVLDLANPARVQVHEGKAAIAELVLAQSRIEGPAVRACMDRHYLLRAVQLGFSQVMVIHPDKPIMCQDEKRTYLWMPLSPPDSSKQAEASSSTPTVPASTPPTPITRSTPMNDRNGHRPPEEPSPSQEGPDAIAEAEALRTLLQDATVRTSRLIGALRHQKRQSRAVQSAMASLRRLQELGH